MFSIGTLTDPKQAIFSGQEQMFLTIEDLKTHCLVTGSTGSGKSRTATQIALDAFDNGIAAALIDIHGDTADDTASHLIKRIEETNDPSILPRLDYLEWSPTYCPRLDSFAFQPPPDIHPELWQNFVIAAREAAVDQFATYANSSTQGTESFEGTPRVFRNLRNAFTGCAIPAPRRRFPTGLVHVLLNVSHPRHFEVYGRIGPLLPLAIQADFAAIHEMENVVKQREQMESALNRVTAFFSSLLRESFGETAETAAVFDWATNIRKRRLTLVNLRETQYFSHQQGIVLARLLFSQAIETMMRLPREQRPEHFILILEESGEALFEPALRYLGAVRKHGVRMIFCGQDLSTFRKPTFDLVPKLLSQCGTVIAFNQRYPEDAEIFGTLLFQGSLDFTQLIQEQEIEGDIEWIIVEDTSESAQHSKSNTKSKTKSHGQTEGGQENTADATQDGWTKAKTAQEATADGSASGTARTNAEGLGFNQSPILEDGKVKEMLTLINNSKNDSTAQNDQTSRTVTITTGDQEGTSGSKTTTKTKGANWGESNEVSQGTAEGVTDGTSDGKTRRWVHIPHKKTKQVETGQLKAGATPEQLQKYKAVLMELPPRHAIVKLAGQPPILVRSVEVPDAFASPAAQAKALQWLKRQLMAKRPYLIVPNLDPEQENRRIDDFLTQHVEYRNDMPIIVSSDDDDRSPFEI